MKFFFVIEGANPIELESFRFNKGQSRIVRIPVIGGTVYNRTRPEPDTFHLRAKCTLPKAPNFHVVSDDLQVFECVAEAAGAAGGTLELAGYVVSNWQIDKNDER